MKKSVKTVSAILLTAAMLAAMSGCSSGSSSSASDGSSAASAEPTSGLNELGEFPLCDETMSFSVMMPQYGEQDPATCWVNEEYTKMTNVEVDFTVVPADGWKDKRSITFASNDLPDVIAGMDTYNLSATEELQYASQGMLIPLNDIIENNSIYFKQYLEENPTSRKLISQDDGEIYSLPSLAVCYHCNYSQKMFINKTWLDNLGLDMPTNTDEYYEVLKAFKEQDANGNGDPNDEIPLITCTSGWHVDLDGFLMCAFTYSDPDTDLAVEDGKVIFTPITDGYQEGLRYLHKLYAEGLLSPESFTNDEPTNTKMNVAGGDTAVIGSYPFAYQNYTSDTDIWKQYEILPPLEGPDGFVTTPNYELTRNVIRGNFAITKDAENPDLIMRWVDYFYSDEGVMFRTGREGVEWRKAEEGELDFNGEQAEYATLQTPEDDPYYGNIDYTQHIPVYYSQNYRESAVAAQDWKDPNISNGTEIQLFQGTKAYEAVARSVDESLPALTVPADKISDYSRMQTEIKDYTSETMVKFITGDMDIDSDWESYKTQLSNLGLDEYMEMTNEAYQNYLNR